MTALETNPGRLATGGFIEAQEPETGVWRSRAYWARKDRGIRLRNAQVEAGDGAWEEVESGVWRFWVWSSRGAPWIDVLEGRHGNRSTYINWECRCDECCAANGEYGSDYRAGIHDPRVS